MTDTEQTLSETEQLLKDIEAYCTAMGIAETTFGKKAVKDGRFCQRIRDGGRTWPETIERIRKYMADNPPRQDAAE